MLDGEKGSFLDDSRSRKAFEPPRLKVYGSEPPTERVGGDFRRMLEEAALAGELSDDQRRGLERLRSVTTDLILPPEERS